MDRLYGDLGQAIAGQVFGLHNETETIVAGENIYPGDPIFQKKGDGNFGYGAHISGVSLTASAALVTGNAVALTVNGVALDPVTFQDSSDATFQLIMDAVNLSDELRDKKTTAHRLAGEPLKLYLTADGITITAAAVVTGGASQATFVSAANNTARFRGIARHQELSYKEGTGFYPAGTAVSLLTHGHITVRVAEGANPDNLVPAYVILSGADAGKFTHDSTNNYDCGCTFRSSRLEQSLALLEVNGLK